MGLLLEPGKLLSMADTGELEKFLSRVENFTSLPDAQQNLILAYYVQAVRDPSTKGKQPIAVSEINALREHLLLPEYTTASQFSLATAKRGSVRPQLVKVKGGYLLERETFERYDKQLGQRPAAVSIKSDLSKHLASLKNDQLKEYLTEVIKCFESKFHRASIVLAWCAAYAIFREWLYAKHLLALNAQMATWKSPHKISKIEDFQDLGEAVVINTAKVASVITKEQHKQLIALLDQRNTFAHPSGRKVSAPIAEAYLTQILDEVIANFG